jgi:hypothetical protein
LSAGELFSERRIADLDSLIKGLSPEKQELAGRLFDVITTTGRLVVPEEMRGWVERTFGSVRAVQEQRIVRVTNRVTLEGALFNELRAARPIDAHGAAPDLRREIESTTGDPFCSPEERTPADVFGRVRGSYSTTASNVAKYDGFHGLVVSSTTTIPSLLPRRRSTTTSPLPLSGWGKPGKSTLKQSTRS